MNRRILKLKKPTLLCLLLVFGVSVPLSSVQSAVVNGGFDLPDGGIGCETSTFPFDCLYIVGGTSDSPPLLVGLIILLGTLVSVMGYIPRSKARNIPKYLRHLIWIRFSTSTNLFSEGKDQMVAKPGKLDSSK